MKTWNNKTHDNLPDGPWKSEPDKGYWVDPASGLDCLIVRGPLGALCGYVGVPAEHPWHGVGYNEPVPGLTCQRDDGELWPADCPDRIVTVHGGLTYSGGCSPAEDESEGICHTPENGRADHVHWFGFDASHYRDVSPLMEKTRLEIGLSLDHGAVYRNWNYMRGEVESLAAQLSAVSSVSQEKKL